MEPKPKDPQDELEAAISELEARLDRLRALYEQYFMGFERLEPSVQRKDVDRRFALLRKAQLRNTAARFRLNVLSQKYSTYALYWARVARQIEAGTYKRHVIKATKRFGPEAPVAGGSEAGERSRTLEIELDVDIDIDIEVDEVDDVDVPPPPSSASLRTARPAALPPGVKTPRLVRRRSADTLFVERPPESTRELRPSVPPSPRGPLLGPQPGGPPRTIRRATPSAPAAPIDGEPTAPPPEGTPRKA